MIPQAILAASLVAILLAQSPPAQTPPASPKASTINVRGCLNGHSIVDLRAAGTSPAGLDSRVGSSFRLKGSKAMMKEVEAHSGHEDEISGLVKLSGDANARVVSEKRMGKGRVYVGERTGRTADVPLTDGGEIEVKELLHLTSRCP